MFRDQALTITFSLLASLGIALTVIPMLLSARFRTASELGVPAAPVKRSARPANRYAAWGADALTFVSVDAPQVIVGDLRAAARSVSARVSRLAGPALSAFDRGIALLEARYEKLLESSLNAKRTVLCGVVGAVLVAGITLQFLGGELIPPLSQGEFSFEVELPEGRPLEATDAAMRKIESEARAIPGVAAVFSSVGGSQENQFASGDLQEHIGTLHVVLADREDDNVEEEVIRQIRSLILDIPEAEPTFQRPSLFSFKTPVEVEVFAYEIEDQRVAAGLIADRMSRIEGLRDVETTARLGSPEIQIRFDRRRLKRLGLREEQVSNVLRNKIRGNVASRYREGDRQIDILVRVDQPDRDAISDIENMVINSAPRQAPSSPGGVSENDDAQAQESAQGQGEARSDGEPSPVRRTRAPFVPIRLGQVAEVEVRRGPAEIRRIRSQRAAVVRANLSGRDLSGASAEIRAMLAELRPILPVGATASIGGQNQELEVSFRSLAFALALAVFLVYLVMASQFESLLHPFIILLTVPLGLVGVVFTLALTGVALSVIVLLGAVVLAGIAVNNGIVLLDYTNRLRAHGMSKRDALLCAGSIRLRPILMTSLTTLLGLLPLVFGWGEGDEVRMPMAVAVIGGLLTSTPFTLFVIPVVYELVDRKQFAPARDEGRDEPSDGQIRPAPSPLPQS